MAYVLERCGTPARILEIISPAGFEQFFREVVALGGVTTIAPQAFIDLCGRYELEMQPDSVPGLVERFGLRFPGEPLSEEAAKGGNCIQLQARRLNPRWAGSHPDSAGTSSSGGSFDIVSIRAKIC